MHTLAEFRRKLFDFFAARQAIAHGSIGNVFHSQGIQKLGVAVDVGGVRHSNSTDDEARVNQHPRQLQPYHRIAPSTTHDLVAKGDVAIKRRQWRVAEMPREIAIFQSHNASWPQARHHPRQRLGRLG